MATVVSNSAASVNPDISVATVVKNNSVYQEVVTGLVNQPYDSIEMTYDGSNLSTSTYKLGETVVATLTMTYVDGNLVSVVRT